jgi:hypothetical protein
VLEQSVDEMIEHNDDSTESSTSISGALMSKSKGNTDLDLIELDLVGADTSMHQDESENT